MFNVSPVFVGEVLFVALSISFSMGVLSGLIVSWLRKVGHRGWWIDGLLGMTSFVVVFAVVLLPARIIRVGFVPNLVWYAFLASLLVPALREWLRARPAN